MAVAVYPEFLREGTAIRDYREPPKVVVGAIDDAVRDLVTPLAARPGAPLVQTDLELAEMAKYVDNSWHALKVTFANEIGSLAKAQGLDGHRVMDILCADTTLNLSAASTCAPASPSVAPACPRTSGPCATKAAPWTSTCRCSTRSCPATPNSSTGRSSW